VALGSAAAGDRKAQTIDGWGTVVDPDGDCRVRQDKGKLTITVPKTYHDLTYQEDRFKLNAPRVLQPAKGDFQLQVEVATFPIPDADTSSSGAATFVSSGLLVWADEKNFIRMERAATGGGSAPFIWVELFQDGKSVTHKAQDIEDKPTHLRVSRSGDKLTFETSPDGKDWTEVHSAELKLPEKIQVGVLAINTTTREFSAQLQGLKAGPR
jgi:regulation of enolase protein 1 (concanavalin A-like superfamily)